MRPFKYYIMNYDGVNYAACRSQTKKKALEVLGTYAGHFNDYGSVWENQDCDYKFWFTEDNTIFFRPMTADYRSDNYFDWPWRKKRYFHRHDVHGNSYFE